MPKMKNPAVQTAEAVMANFPELRNRAGMPAKDSIVGITMPAAAAKLTGKKISRRYAFIHTTETDEYGSDLAAPTIAAAQKKLPAGDDFKGTSRKAAKLSLSKGKVEKFKDLKTLVESLTDEVTMTKHKPPISKGATSKRVAEEERNVNVKAFMYAASRESDNDFHLIIGRNPKATPEIYMTMELSGLPPKDSPAFAALKATRDAFKKFFKDQGERLPGAAYVFPHPPVPVEVTGSLFFDITHATGTRPGPKSLKSRMPVIWEVHPISRMTLK